MAPFFFASSKNGFNGRTDEIHVHKTVYRVCFAPVDGGGEVRQKAQPYTRSIWVALRGLGTAVKR